MKKIVGDLSGCFLVQVKNDESDDSFLIFENKVDAVKLMGVGDELFELKLVAYLGTAKLAVEK